MTKEYSFLIALKEVSTYRVYVVAKTKKEAIEKVKLMDIDEWGKNYGSQESNLVEIWSDDEKYKTLWEEKP